MHSLDIGVSSQVFGLFGKRRFELTPEENYVCDAVFQHRIIISDKILEMYKETLGSEMVDSMITACANQEGRFVYVSTEKKHSNGLEELLDILPGRYLKIMIAEKKDLKGYSDKRIHLVSPKKLGEQKSTILKNYIYPVTFHVDSSRRCESISNWLRFFFLEEKRIVIQDKYILNDRGLYSLENYYLPLFDKDAEIEIYTTESNDFGHDQLKEAAQNRVFDSYNVKIYSCYDMKHDRYIELSKVRITIGAGLAILGKGDYIQSRSECDIVVQRIEEGNKLSIPRIRELLREKIVHI